MDTAWAAAAIALAAGAAGCKSSSIGTGSMDCNIIAWQGVVIAVVIVVVAAAELPGEATASNGNCRISCQLGTRPMAISASRQRSSSRSEAMICADGIVAQGRANAAQGREGGDQGDAARGRTGS